MQNMKIHNFFRCTFTHLQFIYSEEKFICLFVLGSLNKGMRKYTCAEWRKVYSLCVCVGGVYACCYHRYEMLSKLSKTSEEQHKSCSKRILNVHMKKLLAFTFWLPNVAETGSPTLSKQKEAGGLGFGLGHESEGWLWLAHLLRPQTSGKLQS